MFRHIVEISQSSLAEQSFPEQLTRADRILGLSQLIPDSLRVDAQRIVPSGSGKGVV